MLLLIFTIMMIVRKGRRAREEEDWVTVVVLVCFICLYSNLNATQYGVSHPPPHIPVVQGLKETTTAILRSYRSAVLQPPQKLQIKKNV
jgi:hypothetical protein